MFCLWSRTLRLWNRATGRSTSLQKESILQVTGAGFSLPILLFYSPSTTPLGPTIHTDTHTHTHTHTHSGWLFVCGASLQRNIALLIGPHAPASVISQLAPLTGFIFFEFKFIKVKMFVCISQDNYCLFLFVFNLFVLSDMKSYSTYHNTFKKLQTINCIHI